MSVMSYQDRYTIELARALEQASRAHEERERSRPRLAPPPTAPARRSGRRPWMLAGLGVIVLLFVSQDPSGLGVVAATLIGVPVGALSMLRRA